MAESDPQIRIEQPVVIREKNYGPQVIGMMFGVCAGTYIEYGVTREEFLDLAGDVYDGVVANLKEEHGIEPGFGELADANLDRRLERLKRMVTNDQLPADRGAALWYLLGQFDDEIQRIKDKM